jgi:hypothetical protein
MTRTPPKFRLPDLRRAVRAFTDAGQKLDRVEIDPKDGRIIVFARRDDAREVETPRGIAEAAEI